MRPQVLSILCIALVAAPSTRAVPAGEGEDELRAATVLSFLRYSTWPGNPASNEPLVVGVLGRPSFMRVLGAVIAAKTVNGRGVRLVEFHPGEDPRCCHLVYFATDKKAEISPVLQVAGAFHVLTLGETDKFLDYGGAVSLAVVDGHMGFDVDLAALKRCGVEISSTLLRFGQIRRKRGT